MNEIYHGDCLEQFQNIETDSVDVTFADPPFNLNKKYAKHKDNLAIQEYTDWCYQWISEMVRVTKPTGSIFIHNIPKWLATYSCMLDEMANFKHWIAWDAPNISNGKIASTWALRNLVLHQVAREQVPRNTIPAQAMH